MDLGRGKNYSFFEMHEAKLKNHHTIKSDDFLIKLLSC